MNEFILFLAQKALNLSSDLVHSKLYDDNTFYHQFINDLKHSKKEVIIESPFICSQRMCSLIGIFESLVERKVKVYVITRDPDEHDLSMKQQAEDGIRQLEMLGVQVIVATNYDHRKLAIVDRKVLWEGSLNILSQSYSREIMRRIVSENQAKEMFRFMRLGKYIY